MPAGRGRARVGEGRRGRAGSGKREGLEQTISSVGRALSRALKGTVGFVMMMSACPPRPPPSSRPPGEGISIVVMMPPPVMILSACAHGPRRALRVTAAGAKRCGVLAGCRASQ